MPRFPERQRKAAQLFLAGLLAVSSLLVPAAVTAAPLAAPPGQEDDSAYTVGQCQSLSREQLRTEIETAALSAISASSSSFDIEGIVNRAWADVGMDATVDAEVNAAVANLRADSSYWNLLLSGWSTGKAVEFAERVAEEAFTSASFTAKLNELSTEIGSDIAALVNAELARGASIAFLCLREYVGAAYSESLFAAFESSAAQQVAAADINPEIDAPGLSDMHMPGLTGAGIIVVTEVGRRVGAKITQKLAQRVAGKVVGRVAGRAGSSFLPVVGWVVGIGLIVWDLWEGTDGALPQIEVALSSEEVKAQIRAEVADAVRVSLPEEASIVALETAVSMLEEWDAFCGRYALVCNVAAENPSFRSLLATLPLDQLERLSALEEAILTEMGRRELDRSIETGALDALLRLPDSAVLVLTATRSVSETLAWGDLAGGNLDQVVAVGLPGHIPASEVSTDGLYKLLNLNDGVAARKLATVARPERNSLLALPLNLITEIATRFEPDALAEAGAFLGTLPQAEREIAAAALASGSATLEQLRAAPILAQPEATPAQETEAATPLPSAGPPSADQSATNDLWTWAIVGGLLVMLALAAAFVWIGRLRRK